jgi:hypothetical protein
MKWIIHADVRERGQNGVAWLKQLLGQFDLKKLDWVRIDLGREGRHGAYGRCWYPDRPKGYRISIQVPGPFPMDIETRRTPIYYTREPGGVMTPSRTLFPDEVKGAYTERVDHPVRGETRTTRWHKVRSKTHVDSMDEAIIWIGAHEAFHFLSRMKQIPWKNGEIEADAFADRALAAHNGDAAGALKGIWTWMTPDQMDAIKNEHA